MTVELTGRHLLRELDLNRAELEHLVTLAAMLKGERREGRERPRLAGAQIALVFEKDSTRTRAAFEVATHEQGGHVTYFGPSGSHLGQEESIADTARVLGRLYDGIAYRGHGHERVAEMAEHAGVPVWNALTDLWHPTQTLADVLTMEEATGKEPGDISLCFLGDTRFNMARSLLAAGAVLGMDVRLSGPPGLHPPPELLREIEDRAAETGARCRVVEDPVAAVTGVDFVYTDVWVSMGEPRDRWEGRLEMLRPYRVDARLLQASKNPDVRFLHCLPALHDRQTELGEELHRRTGQVGVEVSDDVFSSAASLVFEQAENRMHTAKALMVATLP